MLFDPKKLRKLTEDAIATAAEQRKQEEASRLRLAAEAAERQRRLDEELHQRRIAIEEERKLREKDPEGKTYKYPSREELAAEDDEEAPSIFATIRDAAGNVVRRINAAPMAGTQRVAGI